MNKQYISSILAITSLAFSAMAGEDRDSWRRFATVNKPPRRNAAGAD
jgi:hypothetical protein